MAGWVGDQTSGYSGKIISTISLFIIIVSIITSRQLGKICQIIFYLCLDCYILQVLLQVFNENIFVFICNKSPSPITLIVTISTISNIIICFHSFLTNNCNFFNDWWNACKKCSNQGLATNEPTSFIELVVGPIISNVITQILRTFSFSEDRLFWKINWWAEFSCFHPCLKLCLHIMENHHLWDVSALIHAVSALFQHRFCYVQFSFPPSHRLHLSNQLFFATWNSP